MNPPFDLDHKNAIPFDTFDPFNENLIAGYLYRTPNSKYGMLYITHVNGMPAETIVWATPKMHYPLDKEGKFEWGRDIMAINVYEKLDGTNILAYTYKDADGQEYVTYKTRLRPVIQDGTYGRFESMWREFLERVDVAELVRKNGCNLSFELYGRRNKVLIEYDVSLDAKILFGRGNSGEIIPPSELDVPSELITPLITTINPESDLNAEYERIVQYLNEHIKVTEVDDEQLIQGMEGSIWYAVTPRRVVQYKAKPDIVRDIHFKAGAGIPPHAIYITCVNAFEESDEPTLEYIKELLREEFDEVAIERKHYAILRILQSVTFDKKFKAEIYEEYRQHTEFDIVADKGTVMRYFGPKYGKKISGKVFKFLMDEFGGD